MRKKKKKGPYCKAWQKYDMKNLKKMAIWKTGKSKIKDHLVKPGKNNNGHMRKKHIKSLKNIINYGEMKNQRRKPAIRKLKKLKGNMKNQRKNSALRKNLP